MNYPTLVFERNVRSMTNQWIMLNQYLKMLHSCQNLFTVLRATISGVVVLQNSLQLRLRF